MKICVKCEKEKPVTDFYSKGYKRKESTHSYCKDCFNKYTTERFIDKKKAAIEYLGGCCTHCGYNKYYGALQFHHLDPLEKDMDWKKTRTYKDSRIKEELDKCILLCANCHAEEHNRLWCNG